MKDRDEVERAQAGRLAGPQPGQFYKHYKGDEYVVVSRSVNEDTMEQMVTYKSLSYGYEWTRTLANFCETVNGVSRFTLIPGKTTT